MIEGADGRREPHQAQPQAGNVPYELRLFVAGTTPRSLQAVRMLRRVCESEFPGQYALEVVDIYQQPCIAADEQVVAIPTLIVRRPEPARRLIGDLSDRDRLRQELDFDLARGRDGTS